MKTPRLYSLLKSDWIKAFIMLVLSTIVSLIGDQIADMVAAGSFDLHVINWHRVLFGVIVAVIAYLKKQFFTGTEGKFLTNKSTPVVAQDN